MSCCSSTPDQSNILFSFKEIQESCSYSSFNPSSVLELGLYNLEMGWVSDKVVGHIEVIMCFDVVQYKTDSCTGN